MADVCIGIGLAVDAKGRYPRCRLTMGGARRIGWAIKDPKHCRDLIAKAVEAFGRINILVNNAAHLSGATVAVTGGEPVL